MEELWALEHAPETLDNKTTAVNKNSDKPSSNHSGDLDCTYSNTSMSDDEEDERVVSPSATASETAAPVQPIDESTTSNHAVIEPSSSKQLPTSTAVNENGDDQNDESEEVELLITEEQKTDIVNELTQRLQQRSLTLTSKYDQEHVIEAHGQGPEVIEEEENDTTDQQQQQQQQQQQGQDDNGPSSREEEKKDDVEGRVNADSAIVTNGDSPNVATAVGNSSSGEQDDGVLGVWSASLLETTVISTDGEGTESESIEIDFSSSHHLSAEQPLWVPTESTKTIEEQTNENNSNDQAEGNNRSDNSTNDDQGETSADTGPTSADDTKRERQYSGPIDLDEMSFSSSSNNESAVGSQQEQPNETTTTSEASKPMPQPPPPSSAGAVPTEQLSSDRVTPENTTELIPQPLDDEDVPVVPEEPSSDSAKVVTHETSESVRQEEAEAATPPDSAEVLEQPEESLLQSKTIDEAPAPSQVAESVSEPSTQQSPVKADEETQQPLTDAPSEHEVSKPVPEAASEHNEATPLVESIPQTTVEDAKNLTSPSQEISHEAETSNAIGDNDETVTITTPITAVIPSTPSDTPLDTEGTPILSDGTNESVIVSQGLTQSALTAAAVADRSLVDQGSDNDSTHAVVDEEVALILGSNSAADSDKSESLQGSPQEVVVEGREQLADEHKQEIGENEEMSTASSRGMASICRTDGSESMILLMGEDEKDDSVAAGEDGQSQGTDNNDQEDGRNGDRDAKDQVDSLEPVRKDDVLTSPPGGGDDKSVYYTPDDSFKAESIDSVEENMTGKSLAAGIMTAKHGAESEPEAESGSEKSEDSNGDPTKEASSHSNESSGEVPGATENKNDADEMSAINSSGIASSSPSSREEEVKAVDSKSTSALKTSPASAFTELNEDLTVITGAHSEETVVTGNAAATVPVLPSTEQNVSPEESDNGTKEEPKEVASSSCSQTANPSEDSQSEDGTASSQLQSNEFDADASGPQPAEEGKQAEPAVTSDIKQSADPPVSPDDGEVKDDANNGSSQSKLEGVDLPPPTTPGDAKQKDDEVKTLQDRPSPETGIVDETDKPATTSAGPSAQVQPRDEKQEAPVARESPRGRQGRLSPSHIKTIEGSPTIAERKKALMPAFKGKANSHSIEKRLNLAPPLTTSDDDNSKASEPVSAPHEARSSSPRSTDASNVRPRSPRPIERPLVRPRSPRDRPRSPVHSPSPSSPVPPIFESTTKDSTDVSPHVPRKIVLSPRTSPVPVKPVAQVAVAELPPEPTAESDLRTPSKGKAIDQELSFSLHSKSSMKSPSPAKLRTAFRRQPSEAKKLADLIRKDLWSQDPTVVESALKSIGEQAASEQGKHDTIVRTGGLLAIVRAMETNIEHAGVQISACQCLEKLALDHDNELAIGEVGGMEAISGAMLEHFENADVQEAAWSALWNLTCGNADELAVDLGDAIEALVSCMIRHADHANVQRNACGTLANLCLDSDERMKSLADAGGFVAIAMALQNHWDNMDVRKEASYAMTILLGPAAASYDVHLMHP